MKSIMSLDLNLPKWDVQRFFAWKAGRTFRPTFTAALCAMAAFLVLAGLGTWQVQRLGWKTALITGINSQMQKPPVPMPENITDPKAWEYRRVTLAGSFLYDSEFLVKPRTLDGVNGYHMLVPFQRASGGVVIVDRGWISDDKMKQAARPRGIVQLEGIVELPHKTYFTPANNPGKKDWYWADIGAMASAAKLPRVSPVIVAIAAKAPGVYPVGGKVQVEVYNNHKAYAIFWYVMAVISQIVFFLRFWQPSSPAADD